LTGGHDAPQRHHDPVAHGEDEAAQRIAEGHAVVLHVQPQQAGAAQEADDDVEQEGRDLIEHGAQTA
jgi:hypothetical protein